MATNGPDAAVDERPTARADKPTKQARKQDGRSPSQIRAERQAKKAAKALQEAVVEKEKLFKPREWLRAPGAGPSAVPTTESDGAQAREVKVVTWNMLAQNLVRRSLFPHSDFLKGKDRLPTLMDEFSHYNPNIFCAQEFDRIEDHHPTLAKNHEYIYYRGFATKPHGLLISYDKTKWERKAVFTMRYDDLAVVAPPASSSSKNAADIEDPSFVLHPPAEASEGLQVFSESRTSSRRAAGLTHLTRNVGLVVALKRRDSDEDGVIVSTTHLFWHPRYTYERSRQLYILYSRSMAFRETLNRPSWPVVLAGDFNTQPMECGYRFLVGCNEIDETGKAEWEASRGIHHGVDELWEGRRQAEEEDGDEEDEGNIKDNSKTDRAPEPEDGLLSVDETRQLFASVAGDGLFSAYGSHHHAFAGGDAAGNVYYCSRPPGVELLNKAEVLAGRSGKSGEEESAEAVSSRLQGSMEQRLKRGDWEPIWTNYTPLIRCTLDYLFVVPPASKTVETTELLAAYKPEEMDPGLPRRGIEPSDHIPLGAVFKW